MGHVSRLRANKPGPADVLRALLLAVWAERDNAVTEHRSIAAERDALASQDDRLRHLLLKLTRMQFGAIAKRSHELMPAKLTMAFWMGYAAAELAPVVAWLREMVLGSVRVFAKLQFLFDYGDDWRFQVELIGLGQKGPKTRYPKLLKAVSKAPPQYPSEDEDEE